MKKITGFENVSDTALYERIFDAESTFRTAKANLSLLEQELARRNKKHQKIYLAQKKLVRLSGQKVKVGDSTISPEDIAKN